MSEETSKLKGVNSSHKKTASKSFPDTWQIVKLKTISHITMGQSPLSTFYNTKNIGLPLIQGNNDCRNGFTAPTIWTSQITKICNPNDIILSVRAPVGNVSKATTIACIGRGVCSISPKNNTNFLYYYLKFFEKKWTKFSQGSTFESISSREIYNLIIPLPPLPEQKKIAEILSTWDKAIEQTNKLIEKKELLKRGLIQQLLTGRVRFPEFGKPVRKKGELPDGWMEAQLKDIAKIMFSGVDKKSLPRQKKVRLCNYMDIYNNCYISADMDFMKATASDSEIEKYSLGVGDIMITKDSETPDDIGVPSIVTEKLDNVLCGYHLALIKPNLEKIDPIFLGKQLGYGQVANQFSRLANGATRFGLTTTSVKNVVVWIPAVEEQTKIASILFKCDQEIELLKEKLEKLKEQKKGLMQKLLTGTIRVRI